MLDRESKRFYARTIGNEFGKLIETSGKVGGVQQSQGLRDLVAGETRICRLDAQGSRILIYGHSLADLTAKHGYEDIAHLTLTGSLPAEGFRFPPPDEELLGRVWRTLSTEPRTAHPMGLLRTAISSYANQVEALGTVKPTLDSELQAAFALTANVGYILGQIACHVRGEDWSPPPESMSYAEGALTYLSGRLPAAIEVRAFEVAQMVYVEHELNAGTFGVRIAASAHSDLHSAVVAGECILRGPRHGSANEDAMKMLLDQGGDPTRAREYCDAYLSRTGARLPGFGNAVYNLPDSHDPRATILRPVLEDLSAHVGDMRWYETILALEEYMTGRSRARVERGGPSTPVNVDLVAAPIYYLLGIPMSMYTPLFASARIPGWAAHYLEARYVNKEAIVRPRAAYVGV
jgi:citrate synthase